MRYRASLSFRPLPLLAFLVGSSAVRAEQRTLEVRETAGIRRFSYPAGAVLELREPASPSTRFRLLQDGRPIPAQILPVLRTDGLFTRVAVDFEVSLLPGEARRYVLELGTEVPAGPAAGGLKVEPSGGEYRIANGTQLEYLVPRDIGGLLRSVKTPDREWLARGGRGLMIRAKDGARVPIGGVDAGSRLISRIVKEGPIDCLLVFELAELGVSLPGASARVELEVPRAKSWIRVDWVVDDPRGAVAGLEAELELALGEGPTLADFGAGNFVYAALAKDQAAALEAGSASGGAPPVGAPAWRVLRGPPESLEPYVLGPADGNSVAAEGWAHVMDARRCTAVAVAGFGRGAADRIEARASGRLAIARAFAAAGTDPPPGTKRLRFWLHFVGMPPHVGAVTSPQSMLAPLEAEWKP